MKEQPFYIGQKVVALDNGSESGLKKGGEYTCLNIKTLNCGCWVIDVGICATTENMHCKEHDETTKNPLREWWLLASRFAPVQESFQAISFEKIMEQELSSVN